jgi:hypothetical protein
MMAGPDGTATPMDPMMLGDGDVLGDGQVGPQGQDPAAAEIQQQNDMAEQEIRQTLVTEAYGTNLPQRRTVTNAEDN